jgi:hypothetical protein
LKWILNLRYLCHAFSRNQALLGMWLIESIYVFFQCTVLLNSFHLFWAKPLPLCNAHSIVTILRHIRCYPWNTKGKSFNNKTIVSNEMKRVEEIDEKRNEPRCQKNYLLGADRQKILIIFYFLFLFFTLTFFFFLRVEGDYGLYTSPTPPSLIARLLCIFNYKLINSKLCFGLYILLF